MKLNRRIRKYNKKFFRKLSYLVVSIIPTPRKKESIKNKKKLLIIRIDAIGDFIIFSPMLKYYRKLYKDYEITLLVNKINKELASRFNYIDEIITFNRKKFGNSIFYFVKILLKLRKKDFNVVIYPTYSREPTGDLLVKISNAKEKIGFDGDLSNISSEKKQNNNKYYTKLIKSTTDIKPEIKRNREFVQALGEKVKDYLPKLPLTLKDIKTASVLAKKNNLSLQERFIVINPGAGASYRIWPLNNYSELINWINKNKKVKIVLTGSKKEKYLAKQIKNVPKETIINLIGKTNLISLAAILKKSILYLGSETGTVHIAAAVNTPTICIIGGGHFGRFFPYGDLKKNKIVYHKMSCFNCNWNCKYKTTKCIEKITVKQVINKINEFI